MNRRDFLTRTGVGCLAGLGSVSLCGEIGGAGESAPAADSSTPVPAAGPLRVHPKNPRHFTDGSGKAVYLTGSHTWPNLVDIGPGDPPAKFDFDAYLNFLLRYGHNFTRLWAWELTDWDLDVKEWGGPRRHTVQPHPFARTGPSEALDGKPKFDLTKFDPAYFQRLRSRVETLGRRGIYASVMLFEGWGMQFVTNAWKRHPFHPANNVSGVGGEVTQGVDIHTLKHPKITAVQESYVRKVVDTINDLDNVLYEISNENHPPSTKWQYHIIDFIHNYERSKPKQHPVGMTFQYKGGSNRTLFESPADWISPNPEGGYRDDPPAADGKKVILTDTDHLWGIGGNATWVWKSFLRGMNPLFMDPYDGVVLSPGGSKWDPVRRALGYTLRVARKINLAAMTPQNRLATTGYCLASTGPKAEYLVYLPAGGDVTLDLTGTPGPMETRWLNPTDGTWHTASPTSGGRPTRLQPPFGKEAVLWLAAKA